jgi:hypothetical protein
MGKNKTKAKKKVKKKLQIAALNKAKVKKPESHPEEMNVYDQKKFKEKIVDKELETVQKNIDKREEKIHSPYKKIVVVGSMAMAALFVFTILAIYGIFDIIFGIAGRNTEHFSASTENIELTKHNTVVDAINEVGNLTQEFIDEYSALEPYQGYAKLRNVVERFDHGKIKLIEFMGMVEFDRKRQEIHTEFYGSYLGVLDNWSTTMRIIISGFDTEGVTEENLALYEGKINEISENYINIHNKYIEVLNGNRKY